MSNLKFRAARSEDAERLGEICYTAFKTIAEAHNFPPDFPSPEVAVGLMEMMISRPDVYSVVAENGRVIGSNFLWEADEVDGVGPITVDPAVQNSSIGRELMLDVIRRSDANGKPVRLVQAAYHNRSLALYTKLGFDVVEPLSLITGKPVNIELADFAVRHLNFGDVAAADELCNEVHGISRKSEIAGAAARGGGLVVERQGILTGYSTGTGFFGHSVARTDDDLKAIIGAAAEFGGPGFLLPTRNAEVMRFCLENGLQVVQPMTLMARGTYYEPKGTFLPSILY